MKKLSPSEEFLICLKIVAGVILIIVGVSGGIKLYYDYTELDQWRTVAATTTVDMTPDENGIDQSHPVKTPQELAPILKEYGLFFKKHFSNK